MERIRSGYRVVGYALRDLHPTMMLRPEINIWYFSTLEEANHFAKQLAEDSDQEVDVYKFVGSWRMTRNPVEFVSSED